MAETPTELHEILYVSELAPGLPVTIVGTIVGQARAANAGSGITGLLVFDGCRFCQHLEGPPGSVIRLMDRIGMDVRHTQVRVMHEGPLTERRYRGFEMGLADGEDHLLELRHLDGAEALARFLQLREGFDIS